MALASELFPQPDSPRTTTARLYAQVEIHAVHRLDRPVGVS